MGLVLVLLNIHNERSFRGLVSDPSFFPGHLCCLFIGSSVVLAMVETSSFGEMSHAPPSYLAEEPVSGVMTLSRSPHCHFSPLLSFHIS